MKKILYLTLIASLALTPIMTYSAKTEKHTINQRINRVLENFNEDINIGIVVQDADTHKILFERNPDRYFMPASNEKLFTAYAALHFLKPDFHYQTQIFVDTTKIQNGILNDNVYLQFSGDPTLTVPQLDTLLESLQKANIKQINGSIVVDDSVFDQMTNSPGSSWDDKDFCWGAPLGAIIIDRNCVNATIKPARLPDQPASLMLPNYPQVMQFENHVMTRKDTTSDCEIEVKLKNATTYEINGCIKSLDDPKDISMAISNPRSNVQMILTYLLQQHHISLLKPIQFEKFNTTLKPLASITSPSLITIITTMLKDSDNTIANALFKTIGLHYTKDVGTFKNGSDALRDIINQSLQLKLDNTTFIDGAGASRYDYVKPKQIVTLLQKIYKSNDVNAFMSALPIGGIDGTLKNRMKDSSILGKVHAKTGTETAVTSLSGYLQTRKKHTVIFSIMINGFVDLPHRYKALEDQICKAIAESV